MKTLTIIILTLTAMPVLAHPGHLVDVAGHNHLAAGLAILLAVGIGLWAALKERRKRGDKNGEEASSGKADGCPEEELQDS